MRKIEPESRKFARERMRVLRIAHSSLTPSLRERERALARNYPEVDLEVVTTERWREAEVDVEAISDDLFPVIMARSHFSKHIQLFAYGPRPLIAALCRHRPHLIDMNHEPYSVACAEVLTLCSLFSPQTPIVMQTAQNILRHYPPPFRWLEQRALRRVAAAYVCSETVTEVLRAKRFDKLVRVIPFGVNTSVFRPRQVTDQASPVPLMIGFVGRMLPGKGLDVLAEALRMISAKEWRLLVVGDGPERGAFQQKLAQYLLLDRSEFTGAISYERVPEFYQKMDMLVMPTNTTKRLREQFGRVLVEAMASGVPVIGSTSGAIPEVISDFGLVAREGDADALAAALARMLDDSSLRQRFSGAGRNYVEKHYSWERVADKTFELYCQVLRSKQRLGQDHPLELVA